MNKMYKRKILREQKQQVNKIMLIEQEGLTVEDILSPDLTPEMWERHHEPRRIKNEKIDLFGNGEKWIHWGDDQGPHPWFEFYRKDENSNRQQVGVNYTGNVYEIPYKEMMLFWHQLYSDKIDLTDDTGKRFNSEDLIKHQDVIEDFIGKDRFNLYLSLDGEQLTDFFEKIETKQKYFDDIDDDEEIEKDIPTGIKTSGVGGEYDKYHNSSNEWKLRLSKEPDKRFSDVYGKPQTTFEQNNKKKRK